MTATLKRLVAEAILAIDRVHRESSGPSSDNLAALRDIQEHIDVLVAALRECDRN